jgi:hypothetical protein
VKSFDKTEMKKKMEIAFIYSKRKRCFKHLYNNNENINKKEIISRF